MTLLGFVFKTWLKNENTRGWGIPNILIKWHCLNSKSDRVFTVFRSVGLNFLTFALP